MYCRIGSVDVDFSWKMFIKQDGLKVVRLGKRCNGCQAASLKNETTTERSLDHWLNLRREGDASSCSTTTPTGHLTPES